MENKVLEDIKNFAMERLKEEFGYCGVAESEMMAMLNSGAEGENIIINIKHSKDA